MENLTVVQELENNYLIAKDEDGNGVLLKVASPIDLSGLGREEVKPSKTDKKSEKKTGKVAEKAGKTEKSKKAKLPTGEELAEMDAEEMADLVKKLKVEDVDPEDFDDDEDGLREAIAEALDITLPEEDNSGESLTWEDLKEMDREALEELIADNQLDVDPDDYEKEEALRKAIAEAAEIEIPKKGKK